MRLKQRLKRLAALLVVGCAVSTVHAATYPERPVKVVVPAAAGGISDTITRIVTTEMQNHVPQPFIVENAGGAGGIIGTERALRAKPDGYTLGGLTIVQVGAMALRPEQATDLKAAGEPIVMMSRSIYTLVIPASLGVKTFDEFIAYAKANPGKLSYASAGPGSGHHIMAEALKAATGIDPVHVAYKGEQPGMMDLLGGRVHMMFHTSPNQYVDDGRVIAIAVTSEEEWPYMPGVPPLPKLVPEIVPYYGWSSLYAPKGTPEDVVAKLNEIANMALESDSVRENFVKLGIVPAGGPSSELAQAVDTDFQMFTDVIQKQNISVD